MSTPATSKTQLPELFRLARASLALVLGVRLLRALGGGFLSFARRARTLLVVANLRRAGRVRGGPRGTQRGRQDARPNHREPQRERADDVPPVRLHPNPSPNNITRGAGVVKSDIGPATVVDPRADARKLEVPRGEGATANFTASRTADPSGTQTAGRGRSARFPRASW